MSSRRSRAASTAVGSGTGGLTAGSTSGTTSATAGVVSAAAAVAQHVSDLKSIQFSASMSDARLFLHDGLSLLAAALPDAAQVAQVSLK